MPDSAGLSAHACELAVGVIQKIRQNQQQCRQIRPAIATRYESCRGGQTNGQSQTRQMVGSNPAIDERRNQAARQTGVPGAGC